MIIPLATNAYAERTAQGKKVTSQLTEWKFSLVMPVMRKKVALWCFLQQSSPVAPVFYLGQEEGIHHLQVVLIACGRKASMQCTA